MVSKDRNCFQILIIGGGIGGLGAAICLSRKGHNVTVLEAASNLNEVGAGIQIPPNSTRILDSYGLTEKFLGKVVWPRNLCFRRYCTGEIIGSTRFRGVLERKYGFPYWLIHRADYQRILFEAAKESGAKIMLGTPVEYVDERCPAAVMADGRKLRRFDNWSGRCVQELNFLERPDVMKPGIRSKTRRAVIPEKEIEANDTPNCAFRVTISAEEMLADSEVKHLMDEEDANCWIGYQRHIMAYPIRQGAMYNLVLSYPGQAAAGKWNEPGDPDEMRRYYAHFDPTINKVLAKVKSCLKWKLADLPPLPNWVSPSGKVVLIGDAAHAMVPYLAQTAVQRVLLRLLRMALPWVNVSIEQNRSGNFPNSSVHLRLSESPAAKESKRAGAKMVIFWDLADGPRATGSRSRHEGSGPKKPSRKDAWEPQTNGSDEEVQASVGLSTTVCHLHKRHAGCHLEAASTPTVVN
ncbi:FAD dependent oxidoreductase [Coccidioides immitis H538.4]|uniref:FAD dependent oxidoreductase n=1 Tax=Coccidioides immitis H538.4 TaxID=396776 RepID=A0A0J8RXB1_COCIT|nr:FAD dependent oxidoreductase [Coccidioides immitis H538.4]